MVLGHRETSLGPMTEMHSTGSRAESAGRTSWSSPSGSQAPPPGHGSSFIAILSPGCRVLPAPSVPLAKMVLMESLVPLDLPGPVDVQAKLVRL